MEEDPLEEMDNTENIDPATVAVTVTVVNAVGSYNPDMELKHTDWSTGDTLGSDSVDFSPHFSTDTPEKGEESFDEESPEKDNLVIDETYEPESPKRGEESFDIETPETGDLVIVETSSSSPPSTATPTGLARDERFKKLFSPPRQKSSTDEYHWKMNTLKEENSALKSQLKKRRKREEAYKKKVEAMKEEISLLKIQVYANQHSKSKQKSDFESKLSQLQEENNLLKVQIYAKDKCNEHNEKKMTKLNKQLQLMKTKMKPWILTPQTEDELGYNS